MSHSHGMYKTKFYSHWHSMINRCRYNTRYIKKNITVCDRWLEFENFKQDLYDKFIKHQLKHKTTTLERIDNDGNYTPDNCRWATKQEQNRNKSNIIIININGYKKTLRQLAKDYNIKYVTLHARIRRYGYSLKRALNSPNINETRKKKIYRVNKMKKNIKTYNTLSEASGDTGFSRTSISRACRNEPHFWGGYFWYHEKREIS